MWFYTLPTDQPFNLEFQFKFEFNLEFQPKFSIQLRIPIPMGINLGECKVNDLFFRVYRKSIIYGMTLYYTSESVCMAVEGIKEECSAEIMR